MIYTAYIDETDTHGPEPTIIMAAFIGHAYQWKRFEVRIGRIQRKYGFGTFHAVDFKGRQGAFRGWDDDKRAALLQDFAALVESTLTEGMAVHLEHERFVNEYKSKPIPKKLRLDSHYGACFRVCMARMLQLMRDQGGRDTLDIVLERGHKNAPDCERIFRDFKFFATQTMFSGLGEFRLEDKSCLPLMLADLLAAVYSVVRSQRAAGTIDPSRYLIEKPKRKGRIAFLELAPGALLDLKIKYEQNRKAMIAQRMQRRSIFSKAPVALSDPP